MKVGFLNNQIDNRGTGNAVFDYAHHNERLLGNESVIFTGTMENADPLMATKLRKRFGRTHHVSELFEQGYENFNLDVLYHIKYGNDTRGRIFIPGARYVVHAVFDVSAPHGDRFAAISYWLARQNKNAAIRVVEHMVDVNFGLGTIRKELGIPKDAIVFGRYGGSDSFDIPWVWSAISLAAAQGIHFLFMNTDTPDWVKHYSNIHILPPTSDRDVKSEFIEACDAMLHARQRGETFGISVGEFDSMKKPIVTYGLSPERAHIEKAWNPIQYFGPEGLLDILTNWEKIADALAKRPYEFETGYEDCDPYTVMQQFKRVFLDD